MFKKGDIVKFNVAAKKQWPTITGKERFTFKEYMNGRKDACYINESDWEYLTCYFELVTKKLASSNVELLDCLKTNEDNYYGS